MPTSNSRTKRFLDSACSAAALKEEALRTLSPLFGLAQIGRYEIARHRIDGAEACAAIAAATGRRVERIVISSSRDHREFLMAPYGGLPFDTTLGGALYQALWPALEASLQKRFGPEWRQAKDQVWDCLRQDIAEPLRLAYWDDPLEAPPTGAGESVMTSLFYYVAAATAGNATMVTILGPLLNLLPFIVPIAEDPVDGQGKLVKPGQPRTGWLVTLPVIAR